MEEEWKSSVLEGGYMWVTHTSNTRVCISMQGSKGPRWRGGKEHDRPNAGEGGCMLCLVQDVRGME